MHANRQLGIIVLPTASRRAARRVVLTEWPAPSGSREVVDEDVLVGGGALVGDLDGLTVES
jgi:hypothetical protein